MIDLRATRSLLLSGAADVLALRQEGAGEGSERRGLALMIASAAAFALMAAVVKKLLPHAPAQAIVLSRGLLMTAVFVALARLRGAPLLGRRPGMLALRGLLGYGALSGYFWSVQHLPLGDAVLLQYSHPIWVALLAPLLLREPTRGRDVPFVLVALVGVALIVRPAGEVRPEALVGVGASMCSALAYVTIRQLSRSEHPLTILVWFPAATVPFSLAAALALGREALPRGPGEVAGHVLVTLAALVGQTTLTRGLALAGAARATAVTLSGPLFGVLFEVALFRTLPGPGSLLGMAVVLGALLALGLKAGRPRGA